MLKSGTTVEQGEKRIRARPREAETFLRGRRKEEGRTKPDLAQPGRNKGVRACHPHVPWPDPSTAPQDPPRAAALALLLEPPPRAGTIPRTPWGRPPQHPGVSPAPSHTLRNRLPPHGNRGSLSSRPQLSPRRSPPLRRWGFRGAAATAPPAGPGTHQLLCVFHQALMGRNRLLPLRARPRGLGAPSTRGWGRDRRCRGGQSSSAAPSAKNRPRPTAAAGTSTRRRTGAQAQTRPRQDRAARGGPTAISSPPWAKSFVTGGERSAPRRGPRRVRAAVPARE